MRKTPVIISGIFGNDSFCGKLPVLVDCFGKKPGAVEVGVEPPLISFGNRAAEINNEGDSVY